MSFDWAEYLRLARFLQTVRGQGFSQEAAFRCAVSRAYYSAFCSARNYARDNQRFSPQRSAKDHQNLIDHFKKIREIKIADNLGRLRDWRNQCDYDDTISNLFRLLNDAINEAQGVLNRIKLLNIP